MSKLKTPLNLRKLIEDGVEFQVDANDIKDSDLSSEENDDAECGLMRNLEQCNKECAGVFDEDVYEEEPFEIIAKKMIDLTPDGKIKKRVIREGNGEKPLELATVKIHYNAYLEYDDQPFDSTYIRKKPRKFIINDSQVLAGLDFAVQTMVTNEKSQFLIHPDYAYGKNCFGGVPSNATILFEIELLEIINSGAAISFMQLNEDQQRLFSEVYKYCLALCERGKKLFFNQEYKKAIKDYNSALFQLRKSFPENQDQILQHRELHMKLLANLLICYTISEQHHKACAKADEIYDLTQNGELGKIPAKVFFNHAKSLRSLAEYKTAKIILEKAYRLEPKNSEIANEVLNLEKDEGEQKKNDMRLAKALLM